MSQNVGGSLLSRVGAPAALSFDALERPAVLASESHSPLVPAPALSLPTTSPGDCLVSSVLDSMAPVSSFVAESPPYSLLSPPSPVPAHGDAEADVEADVEDDR